MLGTLTISKLRCNAILGINPDERLTPQPVELTIQIESDFSPSATHPQDTSTTVDWSVVASGAKELLISRKFFLAETACIEITQYVLQNPLARAATVRITKCEAIEGVESVSAELRLSR